VAKTVRIQVADRELTLSHETAAKVWATPVKELAKHSRAHRVGRR
jgi:hypothetical protein